MVPPWSEGLWAMALPITPKKAAMPPVMVPSRAVSAGVPVQNVIERNLEVRKKTKEWSRHGVPT